MLAWVVCRRRRGRGGGGGGREGVGQCTRWRASCASSLLEVDVDLPVILQRQVLAVLYRITVEGPQIQFFDVGVVPQIQFIVRCDNGAFGRSSSWTRLCPRCCAKAGVDASGVAAVH